jgi:hypothetical protein
MKIESFQKSKIYNIILYIVLFFYIYSVEFNGVPLGLGTRVFIGILGFIYFTIQILLKNINFKFHKDYINIFLTLFIISLISSISVIFNKTYDIEFVLKYPISIIIILFASYFIKNMILIKYKEVEIQNIIRLIINVVIIQIIISILMFSIPPFREFLNSIQIYSEYEITVLQESQNFRLNGFGSRFFGAGIINGFALILIASLLKFYKHETKVLRLSLAYLFIFVFGMMMARTTIIGALLSLILLFLPKTRISLSQIKKHLKFSFYITILPIGFILIIILIFPGIKQQLTNISKFGFEMFFNYFSSNSFESESTNKMMEMYIWPSSLKTYTIGDGLYSNPQNNSYYMNTDIGYLRLIYYFGVFGLLSYFIFQFYLNKILYCRDSNFKMMFFILSLYLIILNFKGFSDLFFIGILFLNTYQYNKNTRT